jgi:hypothetical protein
MDQENETNPELFTQAQLEKCHTESLLASNKIDALNLLKKELEQGLKEL